MSKKMMKRSLALGALMASVITGSAMAAEYTETTQYYYYNRGKIEAAIVASDATKDKKINITDKTIKVNIGGGNNIELHGVGARSDYGSAGGSITLGNVNTDLIDVDVNATDQVNKVTVGLSAGGPRKGAADAGEITVNGDKLDIDVSSNHIAYGINANNRTQTPDAVLDYKLAKVIVNTNNTYIDVKGSEAASALIVTSQGELTINGNLFVNTDGGDCRVLDTRGYAKTIINKSGNNTVVLNGDIVFDKYDDGYEIDAFVDINLTDENSKLMGNIYVLNSDNVEEQNEADSTDITGMTLGLSDGATWTTVANETNGEKNFVNTLNMNGGILNVAEGTKVQIGIGENDTGWNGNGTVVVNSLDVAQVTINNKAEGSTVTVQGSEKITDAIAVSANQATEMQKLADTVQDGKKVSAADTVTTTESEIAGAITAQVDDEGKVIASTIKEATNTTNQAIGEAAVALKAHWRAHMNDMNKRMGELRNANGEAGVWARMVRGEAEYEGAKAQYNQYQLGYDEKLSVDKRWTVGAAVTFAEGDSSFGKGTIEDDSTAFAIYGSKLNDDGTFIDLIARYARVESDVTSFTGNTGDYSTNGYSVSAEFGKRIQQGNGLWIEPQVELTYGTIDSADYKLDGKDIHVGDMDSIIGRVGFSIGKDVKQGNVYARASYLYDFDGETETTFTANGITRPIEEDLGGGWWEVGVGANINLSKATYIYADVEKTFGGEVDTDWQWNLGVRYSF